MKLLKQKKKIKFKFYIYLFITFHIYGNETDLKFSKLPKIHISHPKKSYFVYR